MLDDIVVHDIAQGISVPVSTTQNRLLPPWAGIASRLRAHPTGLALLISEQTFQEQACIRRNTLLRDQRTYPLLDLSKRRRPQRKRLLNRRGPRPRHSNHGCPWIQKPSEKATVMLGNDEAASNGLCPGRGAASLRCSAEPGPTTSRKNYGPPISSAPRRHGIARPRRARTR